MKTVDSIRQEIEAQNNIRKDKDVDKKVKRRAKTKVEFLTLVLSYLQHEPSQEYLKAKKASIISQISGMRERWSEIQEDEFLENQKKGKITAKFNKDTGAGKLNKQLKTIKFILS